MKDFIGRVLTRRNLVATGLVAVAAVGATAIGAAPAGAGTTAASGAEVCVEVLASGGPVSQAAVEIGGSSYELARSSATGHFTGCAKGRTFTGAVALKLTINYAPAGTATVDAGLGSNKSLVYLWPTDVPEPPPYIACPPSC